MNAPAPLVDFLLRFRERERENAAQGVSSTPDAIVIDANLLGGAAMPMTARNTSDHDSAQR